VHRIGRVGRAGREGTAITLFEPREHRSLKVIERVTGQPIKVEKLPTVADLRARHLEQTREAVRTSVLKDELDAFREIVDSLGEEFGIYEVALAAVKLAHEARGAAGDEEELPAVELATDDGRGRRNLPGRDRGQSRGQSRDQRTRRPSGPGVTRLFVGTGRSAGIRPQDLVGVITGESNLSGRDIGAIEIADRFSLVEVPESAADDVVAALRGTSIRGRKATVRRERYDAR
jgi:ATP-dependent RNA helicase DeaD